MLNTRHEVKRTIGGHEITLTSGIMAKQAAGSVTLRCGNTVMLAAVTAAKTAREGTDFFPLTIEYAEKMYSAGKIPGGFFKREAKPRTGATLAARLIDRPIRPCFPDNYHNEVQIIVTVLSYDKTHSPEFFGILASSAALAISELPFQGPVGSALVAHKNGEFIFNPSVEELASSDLEIVVAGTKEAILMVEAGASEVSEETVIKAIQFAHKHIKETIELQEELIKLCGKEKQVHPEEILDKNLEKEIDTFMGTRIEDSFQTGIKKDIEDAISSLSKEIEEKFINEESDNATLVKKTFAKLKKERIRRSIINNKKRPDGRKLDEIRQIEIDVNLLPSTHGSALFTRGETQSLGVITLGTGQDEQIEDGLADTAKSNYFFHYNFPPFSVGEVGFYARTSRRELGHGALAERALKSVIPSKEVFPYTIRLVSEIFESNGSSSMASVCSGTLAMMDCGVPIKSPVSGIAMGLLMDGKDFSILSDIQGLEDHYGDMDFKVAGTKNGITALQLDIKISGLSEEILTQALAQAKKGRMEILETMLSTLNAPREALSANAPKIHSIQINPEKIGIIIGPGGKMIRKIEEDTSATISISDDIKGQVSIAAVDQDSLDKAIKMINSLVKDIEKGEEYEGKVVKTTTFGAFVEIAPGKEGLIHISKLSKNRVDKVEDIISVGEKVKVIVNEIDKQNRINLILSESR